MGSISARIGPLLALALAATLLACNQKPESAAGVTSASAPAAVQPASATPAPAPAPAVSAQANAPSAENPLETGSGVDIGSISIVSTAAANGGAPVEIDFVLAFDPASAQEIGQLSAADWFAKRSAYKADNRAQVMSWTVPAGETIPEAPVDAGGAPMGAFVFAHYKSPGDHRQTISGEGSLQVTLGPNDFSAEIIQ